MPLTEEELRHLCHIEYEYADSLTELVFGDRQLAIATRMLLTQEGLTELREPYLDVKRGESGEPIAYLIRLPDPVLSSLRLGATMFLARTGFFEQHPRAEVGSRVGARLLARGNANDYHVTHVWVSPEVRSRGVGHSLIVQCIDEAREGGFDRVIVQTSVRTRALSFYDRIGFRRALQLSARHPVTGATVTCVQLEFRLR
jgi:ribosomal protein S18 acetylase RimI-like enzyme